MANKNKVLKDYKFGLAGNKKKLGVNYLRYIFNGLETSSGSEQMFYVELEMINPTISPSEVVLGFKPRINLSADDLQYALAGTQAAKNINTETIVQPSYCAIRIGMLGNNPKQICYYFSTKDMIYSAKPFQIDINNKLFTENKISGFLSVSQEEKLAHPELFSDDGYVTWDISYEVDDAILNGYKKKNNRWFPFGLNTLYTGKINFDGVDYIVDPRKCSGYIERYWGETFPATWFHISSANISSVITGKTLQNSSFSVQGIFENKVSFIGKFEDLKLELCADTSNRQYSVVWDCTQMPECENIDENQLHWSVSLNSKLWIIDIDIYCRIKDLFNRSLELPEGKRKVLNLLEGASGTGEIKIYKHIGNTLEQIEHVKLVKTICEFGESEESNI